jgi:RHS repeat-associated protein
LETGLDYFGARYYSNGLGRWVSADWSATPVPVPYADFNDPQSLNLYSYVRNIPTSQADADGHCSVDGEKHGILWCIGHAVRVTETKKEAAQRIADERFLAEAGAEIKANSKPVPVVSTVGNAFDKLRELVNPPIDCNIPGGQCKIAIAYPVGLGANVEEGGSGVYNISTAGMTAAERQAAITYAQRTNAWLESNGGTTVQSTAGALRSAANAAARAERNSAARAGMPYEGQAGHVPDTALTGQARPPGGWLDMAGRSNNIVGGGLSSRIGQTIKAIMVDGKKP